ncbi:hypothetical protein RCH21_003278 [Arthrobacter sp. PL16]|nr:hypothetical protein [Arthrobacter sp. PL16]
MIMASDYDACRSLSRCDSSERCFCIIEHLLKLTRFGNEDFHLVEALYAHGDHIPFHFLRLTLDARWGRS